MVAGPPSRSLTTFSGALWLHPPPPAEPLAHGAQRPAPANASAATPQPAADQQPQPQPEGPGQAGKGEGLALPGAALVPLDMDGLLLRGAC